MGYKLISIKFHDRDPHKSLETELENLAAKSDKLTIAVGWFSSPGAKFLEQFLKNNSSLEIELIIGNLLGNVCSVFDRLLYLYSSRLSIKIAHGHRHSVKTSRFAPMMHSKIYYGENGINAGAIVGSTNLTGAAIGGSNSEADIILSGPHSDSVFVDIKQHLVNVAHDAEDYDSSKKWFYHYMARHRQNHFWENFEFRLTGKPKSGTLVHGIWQIDTSISFNVGDILALHGLDSDTQNICKKFKGVGGHILIVLFDSSKRTWKPSDFYLCKLVAEQIPSSRGATFTYANYELKFQKSTNHFSLKRLVPPRITFPRIAWYVSLEVMKILQVENIFVSSDNLEREGKWLEKNIQWDANRTVPVSPIMQDALKQWEDKADLITGFKVEKEQESILDYLKRVRDGYHLLNTSSLVNPIYLVSKHDSPAQKKGGSISFIENPLNLSLDEQNENPFEYETRSEFLVSDEYFDSAE